MIPNQTEIQVLALAKEGLNHEQIAASLGHDIQAVQYILARHGQLDQEEVDDETFNAIKRRLQNIAVHSSDDILASRIGMFLWERKKGAVKDMKNAPSIDINTLNLLVQNANGFVQDFRSKKPILNEHTDISPGHAGGTTGVATEDSSQSQSVGEIQGRSSNQPSET
jgi:hypothetical protein